MRRTARLLAAVLLAAGPAPARAEEAFQFFADEAKVLTAARRPQRLAEAPASVAVISEEDIRASGALNLWDLLRFRAGLDVLDGVSPASGSRGVVSVRGLPREIVDEVEILVDGRSVYDKASGGTSWHRIPVQLQDIARIEVVRGPNAAFYGPNAALGVVNIITRRPRERAELSVRQTVGDRGTRLTETAFESAAEAGGWRLSHTARADPGSPKAAGGTSNDFLQMNKANARGWWKPQDDLILELFAGGSWDTAGAPAARDPQTRAQSHFEMLRAAQELGNGSLELMAARSESATTVDRASVGRLDARSYQYDAEVLHRFAWAEERLWTVWGAGFRQAVGYSDQLFAGRPRQVGRLRRIFGHQTAKVTESLTLAGGVSLDHSDDLAEKPEFQGAVLVTPREGHTLRASYAEADTTPYLVLRSANLTLAPNVRFVGNPDQRPQRVVSYELGYAGRPGGARLRVESSLFYYEIRDRIHGRTTFSFPTLTTTFDNDDRVFARGAEVSLAYAWRPGLSAYANYTYEHVTDWKGLAVNRETTPCHKVNLGGVVPLGRSVSLSGNAAYKDAYLARASTTASSAAIRPYWRLDARLAWQPTSRLELFVAGQNLGQARHAEFADGSEVARSVQAGFSARF